MMKQRTILKAVLFSALMLVIVSEAQVSAQAPRGGRGGLGDWLVQSESNGRTRESIISFSSDQEGKVTGSWISSRELSELKDVSYAEAEGKLSFVQTRQGRDGAASTSKFTGTIAGDVLSGTMSSDRGESKLQGKPLPRAPREAGTWEMKYKRGERDITAKLVIKADAEGKLSAEWLGEGVQSTITDLALTRRDLTFKRTSKRQDQQYESTFAGTLQREGITGTFKSEQGETPVTGTLVGAALIGTWNLAVTSDRGESKQRLVVNSDMSGWYGSVPVKDILLEGDKVSFKVTTQTRNQPVEMAFTGKLAESGLTGELASDQVSQKITGTKAAPTRGGRGQRGGGANG
jgi:hypothetical protein